MKQRQSNACKGRALAVIVADRLLHYIYLKFQYESLWILLMDLLLFVDFKGAAGTSLSSQNKNLKKISSGQGWRFLLNIPLKSLKLPEAKT